MAWLIRNDDVLSVSTGCASQSITFATAYDSLGEEGVRVLNCMAAVLALMLS